MTAVLLMLRGLAGRVPFLAWAVIVALAWGGWNHHAASSARTAAAALAQRDAAEREATALADQSETARRLNKQSEATHDAENKAAAAVAAAAAAVDAAGRLRVRLAAAQASDRRSDPATACRSAPAASGAVVPADLFWRVVDRAGRLAAIADERGIAGEACERAYGALKP